MLLLSRVASFSVLFLDNFSDTLAQVLDLHGFLDDSLIV